MKVVNKLLSALGITGLVLAALTGVALAHGTPELTAKQTTVGAGGTLTLSGDSLGENGDVVTIVLQGPTYQTRLGTVALKDDSFDNVDFTIPKETPTGTYVLTAKNGSISATTQIEVTAPAGATMATAPAPVITRAWTPAEWIVALSLLAITLLTAIILLWRHRVELTAIDR